MEESLPGRNIEKKESRRPNYTLQIYFGSHGTAEDMQGDENSESAEPEKFKRKGLAELFKQADIYVPELHGWSETSLSHLQALSYGRVTPETLLREIYNGYKASIGDPAVRKKYNPVRDDPSYGFKKSEIQMIYQSYKPIIFFDVPEEHPKRQPLSDNMFNTPNEITERGDAFEKTLTRVKKDLRTRTDLNSEREDYMLSQIDPKLAEVFKDRPDLKNKTDLRVLMFLGAGHTRVARELSKYEVKVESHLSRSPMIYSFHDEAVRRLALGQGITNELASRVLLEKLSYSILGPKVIAFTRDLNEADAYIRKIVSLFSYDEIKNLYEIGMPDAVLEFFIYLLKKGVNTPESREHIISFIFDNK